MLYLKGCPRCGGDFLLQGEAPEEMELSCLQCGYAATAPLIVARRQRRPLPIGVGPEPERRSAA